MESLMYYLGYLIGTILQNKIIIISSMISVLVFQKVIKVLQKRRKERNMLKSIIKEQNDK